MSIQTVERIACADGYVPVVFRPGGPTDISNGVLLCRFHHTLVHNMGWSIRPPDKPGGTWRMHPPPGLPGVRKPVELTSKSPLHRKP